MGDLQRENAWFSLKWGICEDPDFRDKWGICEEKTRDFRLNGGFSKRKRVIFGLKLGILEEKTRDFCLNGGFAKKDRVIFRVKQ